MCPTLIHPSQCPQEMAVLRDSGNDAVPNRSSSPSNFLLPLHQQQHKIETLLHNVLVRIRYVCKRQKSQSNSCLNKTEMYFFLRLEICIGGWSCKVTHGINDPGFLSWSIWLTLSAFQNLEGERDKDKTDKKDALMLTVFKGLRADRLPRPAMQSSTYGTQPPGHTELQGSLGTVVFNLSCYVSS